MTFFVGLFVPLLDFIHGWPPQRGLGLLSNVIVVLELQKCSKLPFGIQKGMPYPLGNKRRR